MDRRQEERLEKKRKKKEEKRERVGGEERVTAEGSAERGTVDSSKCIEQVLQNPRRVTFRKQRPPVESAPRAQRTRVPLLGGAGGF